MSHYDPGDGRGPRWTSPGDERRAQRRANRGKSGPGLGCMVIVIAFMAGFWGLAALAADKLIGLA